MSCLLRVFIFQGVRKIYRRVADADQRPLRKVRIDLTSMILSDDASKYWAVALTATAAWHHSQSFVDCFVTWRHIYCKWRPHKEKLKVCCLVNGDRISCTGLMKHQDDLWEKRFMSGTNSLWRLVTSCRRRGSRQPSTSDDVEHVIVSRLSAVPTHKFIGIRMMIVTI